MKRMKRRIRTLITQGEKVRKKNEIILEDVEENWQRRRKRQKTRKLLKGTRRGENKDNKDNIRKDDVSIVIMIGTIMITIVMMMMIT